MPPREHAGHAVNRCSREVQALANLTKTGLIDHVAARAGLTKRQSAEAVEAMLEGVAQALAQGGKVALAGFGTFHARQREARMGRNPATSAPVQIPAARIPSFRPSKVLKDAIN